jgi:hypothetical protein
MLNTIASEDWPQHLPPREMLYGALWQTARRVAATFEFANSYRGFAHRDTAMAAGRSPGSGGMMGYGTVPVKPADLVSYGAEVAMSYSADELAFLVPTLRRDMLNEAERLMRVSGWDYDRTEKRWFRRRDNMAVEAPWLFGRGQANENDADLFTRYEAEYPALVALARHHGNVTHAHQDMGVAKNTFYKRLANERLKAASDAEFMAALKDAQ